MRRRTEQLNALHHRLDLVGLNTRLARRAGDPADRFGLAGADAVHLATAEAIAPGPLVSGHRRLCAAARQLGLAVAELSRAP